MESHAVQVLPAMNAVHVLPLGGCSSVLLEHGSSFVRQKMGVVFCFFIPVPLQNLALCHCDMYYICSFPALC